MERSPVRPAGALMSVVVVGVGGGAATWSGRPSVWLVLSRLVVVVWLVVGARAYTHAAPLSRARRTDVSSAALLRRESGFFFRVKN